MARWTDLAEWVGPTINEGDGDGKPGEPADRLTEVRGLVLHIASGFYQGTIAWQRNASADVSSHFIVARDGRCAQMVDTADRAWTQRSGNSRWLSVELEGFAVGDNLHKTHPGWERLTDAQIEVCARLLHRIHQVYGVPLQLAGSPSGRGLGHHSMGHESGVNWGHQFCPGEPIKQQKPLILARAIALTQGGNGMAGETGYSPATATALAVGATDEGWVDQDTSPGWDNSLRRYNLRRLMTGGDVGLPHGQIARYNLRALAKQLDGVKEALAGVQVTPTDAQWAALLDRIGQALGTGVEAALVAALRSEAGQAALVRAQETAEDS
jgi:hypothetical protein